MPVVALIPVNRFRDAKSRLGPVLTPEQREALAVITFTTVARAVSQAGLLSVALTPEPKAVRALSVVTEVVGESPDRHGLNEQLTGALQLLGDAVLIVHGDLPLATGAAVRRFLEDAEHDEVALVESADGGTNVMLLRPPGQFALAYGAGSFAAHVAAARQVGIRAVRVTSPELSLDLDTPDDIATLLGDRNADTCAAAEFLRELSAFRGR